MLHTGNLIPQLGFGTYQLASKQCVQAVQFALKKGCRHIDSAELYQNQKQISKAIDLSAVPREQIFITSKIGPRYQGYQRAKAQCYNILKRFKIDYLDLLLIHWPGCKQFPNQSDLNLKTRHQTWRALIELKKQGKVKDIGVSNFMIHHLQPLLKQFEEIPAINQFELHPLCYDRKLVQFCKQHKIAIQTYSPLARADPRVMKNQKIKEISKKYKCTVAQLLISWALQKGFIVIPKSKNKERITQNMSLRVTLQEEDNAYLDSLDEGMHTCWNPYNIII